MTPAARFCPSCGEPISSISEMPTAAQGAERAEPKRQASPSPASRPPSGSGIDTGQYAPGEMLAGRYRVIALLRRGGMGEVYRADDLKLGQAVALKFLPKSVAQDPTLLERFHAEVRNARQVSHPNVCRVYDIGEIEGQHFLSMEYVDGEDLATLLKRIGRLPSDKALEIARQLCAGLAAAHDRGVLHRDLKPANVMIDGQGRARITDFGLAISAHETTAPGEIAGTPAYMAPEQLAGKGATAKSDIYALGLVLYELFTGRKAFEAATFAEWRRKHSEEQPAPPSSLIADVDPAVERAILRCLEKDPRARPATALQVAAALPGGDPLAAALAAGETPSPEMVAAAGDESALRARTAWALLGGAIAAIALVLALVPYATDLGLAPTVKSPDVLTDRAREIVEKFGYSASPADSASWFMRNYDFLRYRAQNLPAPRRSRELAAAEQSPIVFQYRQSPRPMVPTGSRGAVTTLDPPYEVSGMVGLVLDAQGRLLAFRAVPPQVEDTTATTTEAAPAYDYSALFAEAGLDPERFKPAAPRWLPAAEFDQRAAWEGSYPQHPGTTIHVAAATYRGKPVYFQVIGPWSRPWRMQRVPQSRAAKVGNAAFMLLALGILAGGTLFARRNLRLGRGDRKGAFRVSTYIFSAFFLYWALVAHHVAELSGEFVMLIRALSLALFQAAFAWVCYMAIEPYIRRRWPEMLISWNRLLAGRFRDPLVGRDCLAGVLLGASVAVAFHITNALPSWFNVRGQTPIPSDPLALSGWDDLLAILLDRQLIAATMALVIVFVLFMARSILRRQWLAIAATGSVLVVINMGGENFSVEFPMAVLVAALTLAVLLRFGLLALAITQFTFLLLVSFPFTTDLSQWYAGRGLFGLLVILGLAFFGFRTALAGQPIFGSGLLDD
jgi:Protein kinase domain